MADPISSGVAIVGTLAKVFGGGGGGVTDEQFRQIKRQARKSGRRQGRRQERRRQRRLRSAGADSAGTLALVQPQAFAPAGVFGVEAARAAITVAGAIFTELLRRGIEDEAEREAAKEQQERERQSEKIPGEVGPPAPGQDVEIFRQKSIEGIRKRAEEARQTEIILQGPPAPKNRGEIDLPKQREKQRQEVEKKAAPVDAPTQPKPEVKPRPQTQPATSPKPPPATPAPRISIGQIISATNRIVDLVGLSRGSQTTNVRVRSGRSRAARNRARSRVPLDLVPGTQSRIQTRQETERERCEKRRRKNRRVCWEGFYREFSNRTSFTKWTQVDCITRKIIQER